MGNAVIKCVKCANCFDVPDTSPDQDTIDIIAAQMEGYLSKNDKPPEVNKSKMC